MKLYSWNINGIRAGARKGLFTWLSQTETDVLCLQETKAQENQLDFTITHPTNYTSTFVAAKKAGYSGVATYSRLPVISQKIGLDNEKFDVEGRVLISKFSNLTLLNVYFPNGKASTLRLDYKMAFYQAFANFCTELLKTEKNLVICGDVNTAHQEIDLARPKANREISGFLDKERAWIDDFLQLGFVDSFRYLHPNKKDSYSWWSQRSAARQRNVGWRIDYFFVSQNLAKKIKQAAICMDVQGSDHCPIFLELAV